MLDLILVIAASYVLGSLPTGIIAGKLARGIDIRSHGSGNTGATNSFRVLGWRLGLVVALVDIAKGYAAVALVSRLAIPGSAPFPASVSFIAATLAAVLGHIFPLFAGFKGGRGFGTAAGAITAAFPILAPFCLLVFALALTLSGYVSVCAAAAALALPLSYLGACAWLGLAYDPVILVFFAFAFALTLFGVRRKLGLFFAGKAELFERVMIFKPRQPSA